MKRLYVMYALLVLFVVSCSKGVEKTQEPEEQQSQQSQRPKGEYNEMDTGGIRMLTSAAASIDVFPVRGLHNTGYDHSLDGGSKSSWNCNRAYSNSDFVGGDHLGIDIWAAEGTPVS